MIHVAPYGFIDKLKSLPFIEIIYIYGSRARGENAPRSDIDIAVYCPHASNRDWQQVLDIIEEADTLLPIDIVRLDALEDGKLKENIERDKKILYRKDDSNGHE